MEKAFCENGEPYLKYGLSAVMPQMLTQGVTGYWYGCPDMVGGGLFADVEGRRLDAELVARSCAISALMPMMQFSLDVWGLQEHAAGKLCRKFVAEREKYAAYIVDLARAASRTGRTRRAVYGVYVPPRGVRKDHRSDDAGRSLHGGCRNAAERQGKGTAFPRGEMEKSV